MALHNYVGHIFSNDPRVWHEASKICWLVGSGYAVMSIFYISMAVLNAQARPAIVAKAFFVGAWLVTMPTSYMLAYTADMSLFGIWLGMVAGYLVITIITSVAAWRSDWQQAAADAVTRSEAKSLESQGINSPKPARTAALPSTPRTPLLSRV